MVSGHFWTVVTAMAWFLTMILLISDLLAHPYGRSVVELAALLLSILCSGLLGIYCLVRLAAS